MTRARMKENIQIAITGIVFILLLTLFSTIDRRYYSKGVVVGIVGDVVTIQDETGHLYDFFGTGFALSDKVVIKFDNNCTPDKKSDDKVQGVEKTP